MTTLAIETSCDETAVAIYDMQRGLIANIVYTQATLHAQFGGIVPELASRDHINQLLPLVQDVLKQAQMTQQDISGIAYTAGPGLIGALLVGATFAKSLAWAWSIPSIAINHLEGHLLAPMLESQRPIFPFLALMVSGGHTLLAEVTKMGHYTILGDTLDDAVGEAFDKIATLLGLHYPGGAALAKLAERGQPNHFTLPRPMVNRPGLDFSFSGLKTHAANLIREQVHTDQDRADLAYALQDAIVQTLVIKCRRALEQTKLSCLVAAGGVAANQALRDALGQLGEKYNTQVFFPQLKFCTDNAAMIAYAGAQRLALGQHDRDLSIIVQPRWSLASNS